jgi:hypothetical protein
MQRCVKIATKSVHYFRKFEVTDKRTLTFIYIYIYIYMCVCVCVGVCVCVCVRACVRVRETV